jgi:subtilisin family serine protease
MYLNEFIGQGVRVAIIDSGVHAAHPHVQGVEQGVAILSDGSRDEDFVDRLGHGTAVAAAIREKAPGAALVAIKVFSRVLSTNVSTLIAGIDEATERGAAIINLSLGTRNPTNRPVLEAAIKRATDRGACVVAAGADADVGWLPGLIDGVIPVTLDWECPRDEYRVRSAGSRLCVATSGYPRDIPSVPRERNYKGISFAVANASGFLARAYEAAPGTTVSELLTLLAAAMPPAIQERSLSNDDTIALQ